MNSYVSDMPPGPKLKAFQVDLMNGEELVGTYIVHGTSILDALSRGRLQMFDDAKAASVDSVLITPLPETH